MICTSLHSSSRPVLNDTSNHLLGESGGGINDYDPRAESNSDLSRKMKLVLNGAGALAFTAQGPVPP